MEDINKLCKNCKHWKFTIAVNQQYVGTCRVKNQHVRQTKSKYTGVHYNKSSKINPWQARYATFKGKEVLIGCFNTEEEAAKARDEYIIKHNLKVRRMNFA